MRNSFFEGFFEGMSFFPEQSTSGRRRLSLRTNIQLSGFDADIKMLKGDLMSIRKDFNAAFEQLRSDLKLPKNAR